MPGPSPTSPKTAPDVADPARTPPGERFPVVGVGASAGGLHALGEFLKYLPLDTGMAFVLIQHLAPDYPSQLTGLLQPETRLPIAEASDLTEVRPDHVYVIQPNTNLTLVDGVLHVAPRDKGPQPHLSIDHFLRSLALDRPGRAIGVVLSGTGSDGTLGLGCIKAAGGITFAHDQTAEHRSMPMNAVSHGCVDFILSAPDIAREIGKIGHHGFPEPAVPADITLADGCSDRDIPSDRAADPEVLDKDLARIIAPLRDASGIDFTHYRPTTIRRRIARRMQVHAQTTLDEYAHYLVQHPEEVAALIKDILINVTSFYRDQAVFAALAATVFPNLIANRPADEPIRIWVIGCATGQEPYSLAIELLEQLRDAPSPVTIQIFATDISDWSLAKARAGWFSESIQTEVPSDRLRRYFTREGGGYRITKPVRDLCVFAKHDITEEIPFGRMDLISCRNVLIYLGPVLQRKVFPTFHFALKANGTLLLGSSETVGRFATLFAPVDERNRIYRRINAPFRSSPPVALIVKGAPDMSSHDPTHAPSQSELQRAADRIVLGRFSPAGVLVDDGMNVIQYRGHTSPYLEPAPGDATLNLLTMVPFAVGEALRQALDEARLHNIPVRRQRVAHRRDSALREIAFEVVPVRIPRPRLRPSSSSSRRSRMPRPPRRPLCPARQPRAARNHRQRRASCSSSAMSWPRRPITSMP